MCIHTINTHFTKEIAVSHTPLKISNKVISVIPSRDEYPGEVTDVLSNEIGPPAVGLKEVQKLLEDQEAKNFNLRSNFALLQENAIKSALSKEDIASEIEVKLMQLQSVVDEVSSPVRTTVTPRLFTVKDSLVKPSGQISSCNKRKRDSEPDHDWDPIEEISPGVLLAYPIPNKSRPEPRSTESSKSKKQASVAKAEARRKQSLKISLEAFLWRHKNLLKKDILKKRAQLKMELQVQMHKEMLEKNKPETAHSASLSSPRKKN
ncbi:unnamed protein product, partial [Meganyctiphanes norvegica]